MQNWFYSVEVWKGSEFLNRYSGIFPTPTSIEVDCGFIDQDNPHEVMRAISFNVAVPTDDVYVHFIALNRV
ncbi:TPA: hypothetical protein ACSTJY_003307 [Serratia fonticola]